MSIKEQHISILGGGWLGTPLATALIKTGYSVKASTTTAEKLPAISKLGIDPFLIDIEKPGDQIKDFLEADILIINIPIKNIPAFEQLISSINKSRIQKVLFVSSTSVYNKSLLTGDENSPLSRSPLVSIEQLFRQQGHFHCTILRFAGLFGPHRHPGRFFQEGRMLPHPNWPVNLIHQDDCIGLVQAILEKELWGETLHACADLHPDRKVFYSEAARLLTKPAPVFGEAAAETPPPLDNAKVKALLGYDFVHPDPMAAMKFST